MLQLESVGSCCCCCYLLVACWKWLWLVQSLVHVAAFLWWQCLLVAPSGFLHNNFPPNSSSILLAGAAAAHIACPRHLCCGLLSTSSLSIGRFLLRRYPDASPPITPRLFGCFCFCCCFLPKSFVLCEYDCDWSGCSFESVLVIARSSKNPDAPDDKPEFLSNL